MVQENGYPDVTFTIDNAKAENEDSVKDIKPFQRKKVNGAELEKRFLKEISDTLKLLSEESDEFNQYARDCADEGAISETLIQTTSDVFAQRWKLKDDMSEITFRGLLVILEHCLSFELTNTNAFAYFIDALGYHTVQFWKKAVPLLYESDMQYGTSYRDALLFSLTLYDVNYGRNRLRELFAAVPGLRNSLLAKSAKRFEEAFHSMMTRRTGTGTSMCSSVSSVCNGGGKDGVSECMQLLDELGDRDHDEEEDLEVTKTLTNGVLPGEEKPRDRRTSVTAIFERQLSIPFDRQLSASSDDRRNTPNSGSSGNEQPETIMTGGLKSGHFQERVINVSNAPPVCLKRRRDSGLWEMGQGSGGLVSCCDPVMGKDPENIWLACFGPEVRFPPSRSDVNSPLPTRTNSLGLPIIRAAATEVHLSMLQEPTKEEEDELRREIKDQMSLLGVLRDYNKDNYKLNPVVVDEKDYHTYYGGISNGLLWPALHNLPQYIVSDYNDPKVMREHWNAYVRVNYQFALNAVRNSRPQDFLWIHDYHLILTGMIIQSLDANFEVGFFLHIPFQPPEEFFTKFKIVGEAVVRALLRFTKVGFQTHLDRSTFIDIVRNHLPVARIQFNEKTDKHMVTYEGFTCTLGVFPVSIKNEDFLSIARSPNIQEEAKRLRENVLRGRKDGKFFFSVERFDYTKGIKEKLEALLAYFRRHPDRIGKDVFLQVAVINRRTVDTYRVYQDECVELVNRLNEEFRSPADPDWRPCIFLTDGLARPSLVAHYLAMDVGVVTPQKDGMNLVAKEMIICNPKAALLISCGAGTEQQLNSAGFYNDQKKCYHRVVNINDPDEFADTLYEAAIEDRQQAEANGNLLNEFLLPNDIEKWSTSFLDPSWTHDVIQVCRIRTLPDFYSLLFQARNVRRQIVERVLNGYAIRPHYGISLRNARISLEQSRNVESNLLTLTASDTADNGKISATFDISDEIRQLEIDADFLNFVQSDAYDNMEQFLQDLSKYHPDGTDEFVREIDDVIKLISKGDHFEYFFSDRDGTLRSYSCTYASSIQGAYSGVIQATFAHRCTQYAAIVTSAPLQNVGILDVAVMPDGYYCYGASGGREWYVTASKKFKDTSISDEELQLLENLADKIAALLENPEFRQFAWLGSGLQRHYGHVTVARQDIYHSIDDGLSAKLYSIVCDLAHELDPSGKILHVSDTETDIKIYLKAKLSGKTFTKGHGIRLFADHMKLNLSEGNILVCGDSETDLPMLKEVLMINPQNVYTVWVTKNEELRQKVVELCEKVKNLNYAFATSPFVILGAMAQATIREIKIRPGVPDVDSRNDHDFDD